MYLVLINLQDIERNVKNENEASKVEQVLDSDFLGDEWVGGDTCSCWGWSQGGGCCPSESRTPSPRPSSQPSPPRSACSPLLKLVCSSITRLHPFVLSWFHVSDFLNKLLIKVLDQSQNLVFNEYFWDTFQTHFRQWPWEICHVSHVAFDVQLYFCSENETFIQIWFKPAWWQAQLVWSKKEVQKKQIHQGPHSGQPPS